VAPYWGEKEAMLDADDRPWGRWEEYLNEPGYRVKRIIVHPGKRLSLQKHQWRSEHWVIVEGEGAFTLESETRQVSTGDVLFIPIGGIHRIENGGAEKLVLIETQLGICLEDDIIRLEDDWGRS
jgi:mannose-6-phosphate isomerase-like protein (cupin superfamily)